MFTSTIKIWVVLIMLIDNNLLQKQCEKQWNGIESFFFILLIFVYLMPMHYIKWETKELHQFLHFDYRLLDHYWNLILLQASLLTMDPPTRLVGRHFPRQGTSRRCNLCSLRKTVRRTIYICSICDTSLCAASCFEEYHKKETLPWSQSFRRERQGDSRK